MRGLVLPAGPVRADSVLTASRKTLSRGADRLPCAVPCRAVPNRPPWARIVHGGRIVDSGSVGMQSSRMIAARSGGMPYING